MNIEQLSKKYDIPFTRPIELIWENIDENIVRAKVFGGWLVKYAAYTVISNTYTLIPSFTFVPDINHEWK